MSKWSNIRRKVGFALSIVVLLVALGFVEQQNASKFCTEIDVHIEGTDGNHFISESGLKQELLDRGAAVLGAKLQDIDLLGLEDQLMAIPAVKDANVFYTMDGKLHARVKSRDAIVRIMDANGSGFYIDKDGWCMPLSDEHSPSVFIVRTNSVEPYVGQGVVHVMQNDSLMERSIADEAFRVATVIERNELWTRLFDHAQVDDKGVFNLIPRVGGHRIVVGEAQDLDLQLEKLKAFYEKGIDQVGWRAYSKIDLRFADQIVCTKK